MNASVCLRWHYIVCSATASRLRLSEVSCNGLDRPIFTPFLRKIQASLLINTAHLITAVEMKSHSQSAWNLNIISVHSNVLVYYVEPASKTLAKYILGSSKCMQCSSKLIALAIVPGILIAGICLVLFLMFFNLTVAVGLLTPSYFMPM